MTTFNPRGLGDVKVTDRFDLSNKNFLITGGGGGIGFACAKAIAQLGGGISIIDTAPEPVEDFKTLGERYDVKTFYTRGDVTNQQSLEKAFVECVDAMGGQLHGALTAAGIVMDTPLLDADWEITQSLQRQLQPKSAYNASKAAIKGLMGPLAGELGAIQTPLLARLQGEKRAILDWYENGAPLQRLGVPEDLTPMVCYLLSDAAAFTTGADMLVTGGLHAGSALKTFL
ncbi:D-arabinitol 2-dehydrogenase [Fusarium beomiforme]|uniref:D-arabinitol 2-dehydrogenase n=1 Tax=Fusarium beomiforme TaxID=44412 RepID=A0A9P5ALB0_9HYPO|nr:D-arabinitol 2-dehydrogenase [Fusarium beomiforme]